MGYNMKKKGVVIYCSIIVLVVILNILAWSSTTFCDWYIKHVFPIWVNTYGRVTGMFPFSVGEILLLLGVICVVVFAILLIVNLIVVVCRFIQKKRHTAVKDTNSLWKFSKGYFCWFAWVLNIVCLIMTLNCMILYHASTFSEQYYGEEDGNYTIEDLKKVRNMVVERCNTLSAQMERDENGDILFRGDMAQEAIAAMQNLGKQYDQLDGYYPRPKPLRASDFFSQQYITGYYFPFSMEANYNDVMYIANYPFTICHELAHLRGYIYEDEANFIGYLACVQSDNKFFQYAGYLGVLYYLDNDLWDAVDAIEYWEEPKILQQVHDDNIFLKEEDWDRIEEEAVIDTETVDEISDTFTDTVLKANGVEDGIISYNRVVELLLWYYSKHEL